MEDRNEYAEQVEDLVYKHNEEIEKLKKELHDLKNKYSVLLSDYNDLKNQGNEYKKELDLFHGKGIKTSEGEY